ncbi:MAG: AarF/ABC1/UbiB kinase family protein [Nitrospirae bacterium]|nr:MAG: AarF/ABC1/UbiB kinase family protein [Nitrospirota bacterium]
MLLELLRLKRTYRNISRLRQIVNVFLKHGFGHIIEQINLHRVLPFRKRLKILSSRPALEHTAAERLRIAFSELGPSFIKLAQLLSSRPDLITSTFADEFKKLQDEVPPFAFEDVKRIIREEMGTEAENLFSYIEPRPVAAASIAQVHYATLKDETPVVIKVQRPGIKEQIETDINIMKAIASLLVRYVPETELFNPTGIVEEFARTVRKELDFTEEAKNMCRFRRNFAGNPDIYIPQLYPHLLSKRIIVMERIEGVRIDNIEAITEMGIDRTELARKGVDAYFKMFLVDGFFHADPHPGNIFVMPDGRIGLVDFGIVGWLTPDIMESIAQALIALVKKDFDSLIDQYVALGLVTEEVDIESFRREFKADIIDFLIPLYDMTISEINVAKYLDTLIHIAIKHRLKIPSDLLLLNKCMLILDNIGRELDPNFNFITVAEPYASKLIRSRYNPKHIYERMQKQVNELSMIATKTPKQINHLLRKALKDELKLKMNVDGFERLIRDIDRATNRIAFSIIVAAIILSSAILTMTSTGGVIFNIPLLGLVGFVVAFIMGFWLLISIIRSGRL